MCFIATIIIYYHVTLNITVCTGITPTEGTEGTATESAATSIASTFALGEFLPRDAMLAWY